MTLEEIKKALAEGKRVYWRHKGYEVIKDSVGQYLIVYHKGGRDESSIGLTWSDGTTLNGNEDEFFKINYTPV